MGSWGGGPWGGGPWGGGPPPVGPVVPPVGPVNPVAPVDRTFSPFGRGVIHPFRRDGRGDIANTTGVDLVRSAVSQIVGTFAASEANEGEMPWRPDFGSLIYLLRHQPNNLALVELARVYVIEAVGRWEPRVRITDVRTQKLTTVSRDDTLVLHVRFNFLDLNTGKVVFEDVESVITI